MRKGVRLELHDHVGERIDLPDQSVDVVISSLVLCSVTDPAHVLAEITRILRPGGRYSFVEHVAAPADTLTEPSSGCSVGRGAGPSRDVPATATSNQPSEPPASRPSTSRDIEFTRR